MASIASSSAASDVVIHVLTFYHPYYQERFPNGNPNHTLTVHGIRSKEIQFGVKQYKEGNPTTRGIVYATQGLQRIIQAELSGQLADKRLVFVLVPSSKTLKGVSAALRLIASQVGEALGIPTVAALRRKHSIDKLAAGGSRDVDHMEASLALEQQALLQGKHVLLLDDVTTSGGTMESCLRHLNTTNIAGVTCLAIAQTCTDTNSHNTCELPQRCRMHAPN